MQQFDLVSLISNPVVSLFLFLSLSVLPFGILGLTSFLKFSVVFSILRNALGAGQIPGVAISSLLAAILSMQVMQPVFEETKQHIKLNSIIDENFKLTLPSSADLEVLTWPWRKFLLKHAGFDEISHFRNLKTETAVAAETSSAIAATVTTTKVSDFRWLLPAFILTELKEAFVIGFALFVPFVAIDLLVTNLLVGLGMMMVSPNTIALPLKILLFVSCDGWLRLSSSLVGGYN